MELLGRESGGKPASSSLREVVILNDEAACVGGSAAVAIASAVGLAARGIPVTLFTAVGPLDQRIRAVENLTVICLGQTDIAREPNRLKAAVEGFRNDRAVSALGKLLADKDPASTAVHAHGWMKALSPFALSTVADRGFPLVVTLHDFFIACPSGGFFVHPTGDICPRRPLSGACLACDCDRRNYGHKLWRFARTAVQNRVLGLPARVSQYIGVSEFSLGVLRPHLPASVRTRVVRNPVECRDDGPAPVARNREFVFVGRCEREKGALLFAEAARLAGVAAVFVGDGSLRREAQARCPGARFTGWLSPDEVRRQLTGARALVFPPLWYETLGLAVIEAAAAGVPAIVSDRCAATDFVRSGRNGLAFARGSAAALAECLAELDRDGARAAALGGAAYRDFWRDPWTVERHVDELLRVYAAPPA
jgi:glycosyltransferase involved in cell wall biosynthesis